MRRSTLDLIDASLQREMDGKYAVVKAVADKLNEVEIVASTDVAELVNSINAAKDFTGITASPAVDGVTRFDPETLTLYIATLKGDKGDRGDTGAVGATGPRGAQGLQGPRGIQGLRGTAGIDGANGLDGSVGKTPVIEFSLDNDGNLLYDVVSYEQV